MSRRISSRLPLLSTAVTCCLVLCGATARAEESTRRHREQLRQAEAARAAGHDDLAGPLYRRVIEEARSERPPTLLLARALDGLADLERDSGRLEQAAALYRRSATLWESLLGRRQPRLATTLHNLGMLLLDQDRAEEAEPLLARALEIWEESFGADSDPARNTRRALERARRLGNFDP